MMFTSAARCWFNTTIFLLTNSPLKPVTSSFASLQFCIDQSTGFIERGEKAQDKYLNPSLMGQTVSLIFNGHRESMHQKRTRNPAKPRVFITHERGRTDGQSISFVSRFLLLKNRQVLVRFCVI